MKLTLLIAVLISLLSYSQVRAQGGSLEGTVYGDKNDLLSQVVVSVEGTKTRTHSDDKGYFVIEDLPSGKYMISFSHVGFGNRSESVEITRGKNVKLEITLSVGVAYLDEITVSSSREVTGMSRSRIVEGTFSYAGKKNDIIKVDAINANVSLNNSRQVFARIAGINVWENDGSGLQLNVSTRGLSPNRSWEFNVRQDGVNIQADVIGYPDTYYTPTMDAVDRIEVVRGAGSLQYGSQLGGMVNFIMKRSAGLKPLEIETKQSVGSYGLFNSYNSIGGAGKKISYFAYYHHRQADGWRENSDYYTNTGYGAIRYQVNKKLSAEFAYTRMYYKLHLSAGLTDSMFVADPRKSVRDRNWFQVTWNLPALKLEYKANKNLLFSMDAYSMIASRNSIENTKAVMIPDNGSYRDLRKDAYRNFGVEAKTRANIALSSNINSTLVGGIRLYKGQTIRGQGLGTDGSGPEFNFIHPDALEYNNYTFNTDNVSLFLEHIFHIGPRLSLSPGIRYEYIDMTGSGYYNTQGNLVDEKLKSKRTFPLLGIGFEYEFNNHTNLYGSATQGFRGVLFNDVRIENPNVKVNPDTKDSHGYNLDIGVRGFIEDYIDYDVSAFYLVYNDRIGVATLKDEVGNNYQYKTNISDSRNVGLESMIEINWLKALNPATKTKLSTFATYSLIDARYRSSVNEVFADKKVEFAPRQMVKVGLVYQYKGLSSTVTQTYVGQQFSDANNTTFTVSGNEGIIKSYYVTDWSTAYQFKRYKFSVDINNIFDRKYFTRRATGYPGPGLIPAEPRIFNFTLGVKI